MSSRDPSPYLFASEVDMLGRASAGARDATRTQRGKRRTFLVAGSSVMVVVVVSLILGVLLPLLATTGCPLPTLADSPARSGGAPASFVAPGFPSGPVDPIPFVTWGFPNRVEYWAHDCA